MGWTNYVFEEERWTAFFDYPIGNFRYFQVG